MRKLRFLFKEVWDPAEGVICESECGLYSSNVAARLTDQAFPAVHGVTRKRHIGPVARPPLPPGTLPFVSGAGYADC